MIIIIIRRRTRIRIIIIIIRRRRRRRISYASDTTSRSSDLPCGLYHFFAKRSSQSCRTTSSLGWLYCIRKICLLSILKFWMALRMVLSCPSMCPELLQRHARKHASNIATFEAKFAQESAAHGGANLDVARAVREAMFSTKTLYTETSMIARRHSTRVSWSPALR